MEKKQVNHISKLIIIGGSSGSLDALLQMLPLLKNHFTIPIVIVLHRSSNSDSALSELLQSRTSLLVKEADEKDLLQPGWIYIAPPDYHLLVEDDKTLSLDMSEKVNYSRPSIDVSFISAAAVYKERLIAVLLSGANADGAEGMRTIKDLGGYTIVQDPAESQVSYMPEQALLLTPIDEIKKAIDIAETLNNIPG